VIIPPRTYFFRWFMRLKANMTFGSMSRKEPPPLPRTQTCWPCLGPRVWNTPELDIEPPLNGSRKFWKHNQNGHTSIQVNIAGAYAILGEKDKAFFWLEKGFAEKCDLIRILTTGRALDSVRSDSRYADLLRRMNIPQ
jgi:hypothetical protein